MIWCNLSCVYNSCVVCTKNNYYVCLFFFLLEIMIVPFSSKKYNLRHVTEKVKVVKCLYHTNWYDNIS